MGIVLDAAGSVLLAGTFLALTLFLRLSVLRILFAHSAFFRGHLSAGTPLRQYVFRKFLFLVHSRLNFNELVLGGGVITLLVAALAVLPLTGTKSSFAPPRTETLFLVLVLMAGLIETSGMWLERIESGWRESSKQLSTLQFFVMIAYLLSNGISAAYKTGTFLDISKINFLALRSPFVFFGLISLLAIIPFVVRDIEKGPEEGRLVSLKDQILEITLTTFTLLLFLNEGLIEGAPHLIGLSLKVTLILVVQEVIRTVIPLRRWDRKERLLLSGAVLIGFVGLAGLWIGVLL